jgi:hypothetical protein
VNLPAGINLNFMPIELADSGNSTGVELLVVAGGGGLGIGVLGSTEGGGTGLGSTTGVLLVATGGVGCERSHPQIATTATQTTADLKRCTLASLKPDQETPPTPIAAA